MEQAVIDAMVAELAPVRNKYAEERDKRLKKEGINQYTHIAGEFSYFEDDPYIAEASRDAHPQNVHNNYCRCRIWWHSDGGRTQGSGHRGFRDR